MKMIERDNFTKSQSIYVLIIFQILNLTGLVFFSEFAINQQLRQQHQLDYAPQQQIFLPPRPPHQIQLQKVRSFLII